MYITAYRGLVDPIARSVHDKCMAVKTITIDLEAYEALARRKRAGQSFSQVIKEHFGPQPTAGRFLERLRNVRLPEAAVEAADALVRDRADDPARVVLLDADERGRR